ncbi:flavin reductase family protein [Actinomadura chibensis]|nr:flavin reductase family protein [Actinomadura chibensis]
MSAQPYASGELGAEAVRRTLGAFATGVVVMTVGGETPHAMTANSFTSVSLDPPLVLVCVGHDAVMHACMEGAEHFGISVLAAHQHALARHFADRGRPLGAAQFESVDWSPGPATGAPVIGGALAALECEVWRRYEGGDHSIFVGRILSLERRPHDAALLFHAGRMLSLDHARSLPRPS